MQLESGASVAARSTRKCSLSRPSRRAVRLIRWYALRICDSTPARAASSRTRSLALADTLSIAGSLRLARFASPPHKVEAVSLPEDQIGEEDEGIQQVHGAVHRHVGEEQSAAYGVLDAGKEAGEQARRWSGPRGDSSPAALAISARERNPVEMLQMSGQVQVEPAASGTMRRCQPPKFGTDTIEPVRRDARGVPAWRSVRQRIRHVLERHG